MSVLSSSALTARLYEIRKSERGLLVEFLGCLAELERRNVIVELGFATTFEFCTDHLGLTRGSAFRRTKAARLLGRFPVIAEYLTDGRLNLTNLVELRDVLDESNVVELLDRASGRTEEEVKRLVVALRPQPAQADLFRRLPSRQPPADLFGSAPAWQATIENSSQSLGPDRVEGNHADSAPPVRTMEPMLRLPEPTPACEAPRPPGRPSAQRPPQGRLEPIAPQRHVLRVTVSDEFAADLQAVKQELSHKLPCGDLEEVLHECIRVTLETLRRRRRGAGKATTSKPPPKDSRYIPAAIRKAVWERDGGQCAFVGNGRRCTSRHRVQVHHHDPFGKKGPATLENLSLRCQIHNLHAAEKDYGREHMARFRKAGAREAVAVWRTGSRIDAAAVVEAAAVEMAPAVRRTRAGGPTGSAPGPFTGGERGRDTVAGFPLGLIGDASEQEKVARRRMVGHGMPSARRGRIWLREIRPGPAVPGP